MSLSLKRSRLVELEKSCLNAFTSKTATKKLSQQNILHNEHFKMVLKQCILSAEEYEVQDCLKVCCKLVKQGLIGAKPLLIMAQQILPASSVSRSNQSRSLSNFVKLLVRLSKTNSNDGLIVEFATGDDRIIPALLSESHELSFKEFLLGNPDLVLKSMLTSKHYSAARLSLLSSLVCNPSDDSFELLLMFLIWNTGRLSFEELSILKPIANIASSNLKTGWESTQGRLFAAYFESLVDCFISYGYLESELVNCLKKFTKLKMSHTIKDCSLDGLVISIPILVPACSLVLANCVLKHALVTPSFHTISSIAAIFVLCVHGGNLEMISLCKQLKTSVSCAGFDDIPLISIFGKRSRHIHKLVETGDLSEVFQGCESDVLFFSRCIQHQNTTLIAESLIKFVSFTIADCADASLVSLLQIWLVEFIERYLNEFEIQSILPLLCRYTSSNYNLLYAFVQKKLKALDFCSSISEQGCLALSLHALLENSESRQSRLNFISFSCLAFLSKFVNCEIPQLDVRNLIVVTKILVRLSLILAVDPRMVWSKYFQDVSQLPLKLAAITFVQAFKVIPNCKPQLMRHHIYYYFLDKDGNIEATKLSAVQFLYSAFDGASQETELLFLAETLAQIDVPTLKVACVSLTKVESEDNSEEFVAAKTIELLKDSIFFNTGKLFNHLCAIESSHLSEKLIAHLIEHEILVMPRPLFVGSNDSSVSDGRVLNETPSTHPAFFNEFLEQYSSGSIANFDDFVKVFKSNLVLRVPSITGLLWFVRPWLVEHVMKFTKSMISSIDDQSLLKAFAGYNQLVSSLKGPSTPQFASSSLVAISALQRELYNLQIISEAQLANGWIRFLVDIWNDTSNPFNRYIQNDDFCCAMAVSYLFFNSCSPKSTLALVDSLFNQIELGKNIKTFASFSCAIDALVILAADKLLCIQSKCQNGYRLFAYVITCCRYNFPIADLDLPDSDDWTSLASAVLVNSSLANLPSKEPAEQKGILNFLKCKKDASSIEAKYYENATSSKNIPALLKFDSVLYYLCSKGLNLITMRVDKHISLDLLKQIYKNASDAKTRALVDLVAFRNQSSYPSESPNIGIGISFERFKGKSPLLYHVCCITGSKKFRILNHCSIIPRIDWPDLSADDFDFLVKHMISLTPVTKSIYCNQSILHAFRSFFKIAIKQCQFDTRKAIEIIFSQLPEVEANAFYNDLIVALPSSRLESFLKDTLELVSLAPKLTIQIPSCANFIVANYEILKSLKDKRFEFADDKISILLDDSIAIREKLTLIHDRSCLDILGKLLNSLSSSKKIMKLIELLDCTYFFEFNVSIELLICHLVSEFDFDYQLKVLLEGCLGEARDKISNRIENLSDELFCKFQEVFEIIEFASSPF